MILEATVGSLVNRYGYWHDSPSRKFWYYSSTAVFISPCWMLTPYWLLILNVRVGIVRTARHIFQACRYLANI